MFYFWLLWQGDNLKLAREEDVMDAVERAADAVDAFTREWLEVFYIWYDKGRNISNLLLIGNLTILHKISRNIYSIRYQAVMLNNVLLQLPILKTWIYLYNLHNMFWLSRQMYTRWTKSKWILMRFTRGKEWFISPRI